MVQKYEFEVKIHKTTDKKKLATKEMKDYEYGTINIRSPELAKHIGKKAKITVKLQKE
ncbi:MAG: hypothetical protein ABH850_01685 [Candidatus Micrarchaeota archaeon]